MFNRRNVITGKLPFMMDVVYREGEGGTGVDVPSLDDVIGGGFEGGSGGAPPVPPVDEPTNPFTELDEGGQADFLASIENAAKQDDNGNIVDAEGNILVKSDELGDRITKFKTSDDGGEPDGGSDGEPEDFGTIKVNVKQGDKVVSQEFKLDKDGNAVDDNGNIKVTKEQIAEARGDEEPESNYISGLNEQLGFEFKDENGNPITYTDDDEGIVNWAKDIVRNSAIEAVQQYKEANPRVAAFANHIAAGGSEEDFFSSVNSKDWRSVELGDDEGHHYNLVYESFKSKGFSEEKARKNADRIKDSGADELKSEAHDALEELKQWQTQKETADREKIEANEKTRRDNVIKYWNEVKSTISEGSLPIMKDGKELMRMNIPAGERDGFFEYLAKRVDDNGNSQAVIDKNNMDNASKIALDYIIYKGFDLKKLVDSLVGQSRVNNLKKTFGKTNEITLDGNSPDFGTKGGATEITIDTLLG